ncbi:MAG: ABC transporter substrate-binding protein [Anaerolineae bacterium]
MKHTRRQFLKLSAFAATGVVLAACTPTAVPSTAVPKADATKPAATSELEGEVVINCSVGSPIGWQVMADDYMAIHPKVNVIVDMKLGDNTTRDQFYQAQMASGAPRMSLGNINSLSDLFGKGAFVNWDDYMDRINPYTGTKWRDLFAAGALDVGRFSPTEQYMLSIELVQILFFFNMTMAKELGLDPNTPPKTWDELQQWMEAAVAGGKIGLDMIEKSDAIDWFERNYADSFYSDPYYWEQCAAQKGDFCFDPDKAPFPAADWATNVAFDDPDKVDFNKPRAYRAFREGYFLGDKDRSIVPLFDHLKKVLNKKYLPPGWRGITAPQPLLFLSGRALCVYQGGWFLSSFDKSIKRLQAGTLITTAEGEPTPTPDPGLAGVKGFDLGLFPNPLMSGEGVAVKYQRTIEQPIGFWGIPVKTQKQNELEIDFTMFITSPKQVARKWEAELDPNNDLGGVIGPPAIKGVEMPGKWKEVFAKLKFQGNSQKPHPFNMVNNGLPGNLGAWRTMMADVYDGVTDSAEYAKRLRKMRDDNWVEELKIGLMVPEDLDNPEKKPAGFA